LDQSSRRSSFEAAGGLTTQVSEITGLFNDLAIGHTYVPTPANPTAIRTELAPHAPTEKLPEPSPGSSDNRLPGSTTEAYLDTRSTREKVETAADDLASESEGSTVRPPFYCPDCPFGSQSFKTLEALVSHWAGHANDYGDDLSTWEKTLFLATDIEHEAFLRLLLERGTNLECRNNDGDTPLIRAVYQGHEAIVRLLLEKGADLEYWDKYGDTPLTLAVCYGKEAVIRLLLEKGADLECRNKKGDTPLTLAACYGHKAVVRLLLEKGAQARNRRRMLD